MRKISEKSSKPKGIISKRQSLRKFQLVSGLVAFVIVAAGAGAVSVLSQRSADTRSAASGEPVACNAPCRFEEDCKKFNSNYTCYLGPITGDEPIGGVRGVCRNALALEDATCYQSEYENQVPLGWVDTVAGPVIYGWAADPDTINQSIYVKFYLDDTADSENATYLGEVLANSARPDVNTHLGITDSNVKHGYQFTVPNDFLDGKEHKIFAYGVDTSGAESDNAVLEPTAGKVGTLASIGTITPTVLCSKGSGNTATFTWPHNPIVEKYVLRIDQENSCKNPDGTAAANGWFCGDEQGFKNDTGDQWIVVDAASYCKSGTCTMLRTVAPVVRYSSASIQWMLKGDSTAADKAKMGFSGSFTCAAKESKTQTAPKTPVLRSFEVR